MSAIFYLGFLMFVASTIAFIVAILTPFWIIKTNPDNRGIFEACDVATDGQSRSCYYILLYSNLSYVQQIRTGWFSFFLNFINRIQRLFSSINVEILLKIGSEYVQFLSSTAFFLMNPQNFFGKYQAKINQTQLVTYLDPLCTVLAGFIK